MRIAVVLLLIICGCTREEHHKPVNTFTLVGVPIRVLSGAHNTIDSRVEQMVVSVIKVKEGRYDEPNLFYDFDEGTRLPLKIGRTYLFVGGFDGHGIYFSKVEELKMPNQAAEPASPNHAGSP